MSQLRSATATAVVSELPIETSPFLSQLLGNKYVPNVPLFPEEKYNSIPFTQHFFYYALADIVHVPAVASKFGISEKQVAEISEINRSLNEINEDKKNRFPNPDRPFFHASDYARNEALKILTNEQAVLLAREEMLIRFEISPSTVLSRLEVQKYLGLEEMEAKYLVSVALKAEEKRADISIQSADYSLGPWPLIQVSTDDPVHACMASQYAVWPIKKDKFFAMGSGPMRSKRGREPLLLSLGVSDSSLHAVGVLEYDTIPDDLVIELIATECGVG